MEVDKDLEFLLNSEFSENYRNEELKSFLMKFKYYFRLVWGQSQTRKTDLENRIMKLESENIKISQKLEESRQKVNDLQDQIERLKKRGLIRRVLNKD